MTRSVLLIGGIDSSGGAGLLRDSLAVAALGVVGRVAVTAVTAQDDLQVASSQPMPAALVAQQMRLAFQSGISVVKIGMLANASIVSAVAGALQPCPLVIDPVLQATSGRPLLDRAGLAAVVNDLLPKTTVLTPNLPELMTIGTALGLGPEALEVTVVTALLARGTQAVLVKGGHRSDPDLAEDRLYQAGQEVLLFRSVRRPGNLRGTGCQLASGIAAGLALGMALPEAVACAKAKVEARFQAISDESG